MPQMIFVNLPVTDLDRSTAFYEAVGATKNPRFSDDTASGMVITDVIHVMLLTHAKWRTFTDRPIPPATSSEVMLALSCDSREAVDAMIPDYGTVEARCRVDGGHVTVVPLTLLPPAEGG